MFITFIQTGGTIDKDYPQGENDHGYEFKIGEPAVRAILNRANPSFRYEVVELLKKDSLDITENDREAIVAAARETASDKVVITHGTDTVHYTAQKLSRILSKTIVLTGAMLPEKFYASDAMFNVGMAVGSVGTLPYGVYIALNGQVVVWDQFKPA